MSKSSDADAPLRVAHQAHPAGQSLKQHQEASL